MTEYEYIKSLSEEEMADYLENVAGNVCPIGYSDCLASYCSKCFYIFVTGEHNEGN